MHVNEPIVISVLIAITVGVLSFLLLRAIVELSLKRRGEVDEQLMTFSEQLEPYLRLIPLPAPVRKAWVTDRLTQRLRHAGITWDPGDFARLHWALIWIIAVLAAWMVVEREFDLVGVFLAGLFLLSSLYGPGLWLGLQADRRKMEIDLSIPDFMDRLALGLEAGLGFEIAFRRTSANFHGLLGMELRRVIRQLERGHTMSGALEQMMDRIPSRDLRAFVASVLQSERLGTSLARGLRMQTNLLRSRRRRRAQEASRRLPILIVFPLVFCFLPALMIIYIAPPILHLIMGQ
jgi:tight adherence protein C